MKKYLSYAIVLAFMMCILAGQLSASAEGSVVIQKVVKDTVMYEEASTNSAEIG